MARQCIGFVLLYISCDRFMAVAFFARYLKLDHHYAWRLVKVWCAYVLVSAALMWSVWFLSDQEPWVAKRCRSRLPQW